MPQVIDVCPVSALAPGEKRLVEWEDLEIGVFNCDGALYAIEDRCSHDDGPLAEAEFDPAACTVECPRHGSLFDLGTGEVAVMIAEDGKDLGEATVIGGIGERMTAH